MHRSTELNESARIAGLGEVRRDLNCCGTHCEGSCEMTQHRRGVRNCCGTRAPRRNVLRKISLQFCSSRNVCGAAHQVLANGCPLVSEKEEQLVFHDRTAESAA